MLEENEHRKIIPIEINYFATDDGRIISREDGEELPTTIGFYGNYKVVRINGHTATVHSLVAIAWHPLPEDKQIWELQVNHKDGNKLNNHKSNLEWVTVSQNRIHALETRLAPSKWLKVKDLRDGTIKVYRGVNECAKQMGLPASSVSNYLKDPSKVRRLYYVFVPEGQDWPNLTEKDIKTVSDGTTNPVERHCQETGEMVLFKSMKSAAESIGTKSITLYYHMRKHKDKPYKGYVFKNCTDPAILAKHQKEYRGKKPAAHCKRKPRPIVVVTLVSGIITHWPSTEAFADAAKLKRNTVRTAITRNNGMLTAGYQVFYKDGPLS